MPRVRLGEAGVVPAYARKLRASVAALRERSAEALRLHERTRLPSRAPQRPGGLRNGSDSRAASSRAPESVGRCVEA